MASRDDVPLTLFGLLCGRPALTAIASTKDLGATREQQGDITEELRRHTRMTAHFRRTNPTGQHDGRRAV